MADLKPVTHVIFDMDGLLLDTEKIYQKTFADVLANYGKEYANEVRVKVMGTQPVDSFRIIVETLELDVAPEKLGEEIHELLKLKMHLANLMPGAERLIRHLHSNNIPIAVATSSGKDTFEIKTSNHKPVFNLFHHIVVGSSDPEVKQGKPAPDIFLVCASRFDASPSPDQCLVFEDAPNGVKAATSAGMQVVMVPDVIIPEEKRALATKVLRSLEDFKPEEFGLPPFSD